MAELRTYLDHAATTPLREAALAAWLDAQDRLSRQPGNPSSLHNGGRAARQILEESRGRLAEALDCEPGEVIFTSGATESAALGITGAARFAAQRRPTSRPATVVGSGVDHPAVREQSSVLASYSIGWSELPVDGTGLTCADAESVLSAVGDSVPVLATLALVCSETGVVQPVQELVDTLRSLPEAGDSRALVHTDATQAVDNMRVSFRELGVDLMTVGGHKFGAPVGTGALVVSRSVSPVTDRPGGGQERKIRSGTQDVAGAAALSVAAAEAQEGALARRVRHAALRDRLLTGLPEGVRPTTDAETVPSIVHLSLPTRHPEVLLLEMDRAGVCVSAGSACHAGVTRPSPVLLAMGRGEGEALGVLRVSFGSDTTSGDVDRFLAALPSALASAQRMDEYDGGRDKDRGSRQ